MLAAIASAACSAVIGAPLMSFTERCTASPAAISASTIGVLTSPGQIRWTAMPRSRSSMRIVSARPTTPNLDAEYAVYR